MLSNGTRTTLMSSVSSKTQNNIHEAIGYHTAEKISHIFSIEQKDYAHKVCARTCNGNVFNTNIRMRATNS